MRLLLPLAIAALALSACDTASGPEVDRTDDGVSADAESSPDPVGRRTLAGHFTGPEGMFVTVTPLQGRAYELDMRWGVDDEMTGRFQAIQTSEGIAFKRGGEALVLKSATGEETNMKWLADKCDCVMVSVGEGYCKD